MFEKELVVIALYPGMKEDIREISASMKIHPTIIEWDVAEYALVEHLKRYFQNTCHPDVIISRGATANLIEQYFPDVASVRAEIEEVALLSSIREASRYGSRLGLLMFEEFVENFNLDASRKLLDLPLLQLYPFRTGEDIQNQVRQGKADGLDAMVGTRMAARTGKHIGIPVISPESGRLALQKALKQAVSVIQARRLEKIQLRSYNEAVSSIMEGVLTIENGRVIVANKVACDIFRVAEANMIGKKILDLSIVKLSENIRRFLTDGQDNDEVLKIQRQNYFVKKTCLNTENHQQVIVILRGAREIQEQENRVRTEMRKDGFVARYHFPDIVAESAPMRQLLDKAAFYASTDANILISGESGTGKELLAQSIHNASARQNEPFVAVNCAAIPASLLESELFGYEEGAFSGAKKGGKRGLFELAHKGTIFLDEINSMPIELQSAFLRTLQEKEIRRIGSQRNIYVDIRVIAASNYDLSRLIQEEKFRPDLYYRLNTLRLAIPSLRERREDIRPLACHYLQHYGQKYGVTPPELSPSDYAFLEDRAWPGNVRELNNVIHRYVILSQGHITSIQKCFDAAPEPDRQSAPITASTDQACQDGPPTSDEQNRSSMPMPPDSQNHLNGWQPDPDSQSPRSSMHPRESALPDTAASGAAPKTLAVMEYEFILSCLQKNHGNRQKTAQELGIARSTLWKKLESYKITPHNN